ncbi:MAG: TSUP family transporter [Lachnospiraceae bacterium]|nr:TSUP family transporter [Lachnospiraceae bacterium]
MTVSLKQILIACPLCFLAGFVDSIGGGGGIISLPAFMLAGLPAHMAIGTNKVQSFLNTSMSTYRMWKNKKVVPLLAVPTVAAAFAGSWLGAKLNLIMSEKVLSYAMIVILPVVAVVVLSKKAFAHKGDEAPSPDLKTALTLSVIAFIVGMYDGFYGPGTGTFLIIGFVVLGKLGVGYANGHAKVVNLTTSTASMIVYLLNGQAMIPLGIVSGLAAMVGSYIGSGLVLKNGAKIVRPIIILVLVLLVIKIVTGF